MKKELSLFVLLALFLTTPFMSMAAESSEAILDQINPAWQRLDALTGSYLTEAQQKTMQKLAFAAAVADTCKGFEVDKDKFIAAFKDFKDEKQTALPAEELEQLKDKLLVAYGMATGLFSAEGLLVKERFCSSAEKMRTDSTDHFWKSAE